MAASAVSIHSAFAPLRSMSPRIHAKALCEGSAGAGTVIEEYAYVSVNAEVGSGCHVGACAHVDGILGDGVVLEPGAFVGTGVRIGEGALVRAGSIVLDEVAPHTVVAGSPARQVG
jgi:tetrahydrodipicolinate N-acetyltransferase